MTWDPVRAELALEDQLTRPGPGRDHLARLLDPLAAHPELLDTVIEYVRQEHGRQASGVALGVHPNTVSNRLAKAGELLGLDLTRLESLWQLRAAVIVRREHLRRACGAPPGLSGEHPGRPIREGTVPTAWATSAHPAEENGPMTRPHDSDNGASSPDSEKAREDDIVEGGSEASGNLAGPGPHGDRDEDPDT
ncbi:helix-turn-helix domain-containing protein [Nocardia sp. NPDC050697]|uniref:helix-turn-helix domain-containing protein n=1 Tax=Nocardia sp. NPDC050697 TaxID=3155158 RepID=UPI0033F937BC